MTSPEVIETIIDLVKNMLLYLLPVIALLSGLNYIFGFLLHVTLGQGRRVFRD